MQFPIIEMDNQPQLEEQRESLLIEMRIPEAKYLAYDHVCEYSTSLTTSITLLRASCLALQASIIALSFF